MAQVASERVRLKESKEEFYDVKAGKHTWEMFEAVWDRLGEAGARGKHISYNYLNLSAKS